MANIYWGGIYLGSSPPACTHNWNDAANWYSTPGQQGGCCPCIPAVPAGHVPAPGDNVIFGGGFAGNANNITTGPTGGWAGPISWLVGAGAVSVLDGTFTVASFTIGAIANTAVMGGTVVVSGTVTLGGASFNACGISGGTWNGQVTLKVNGTISGGTFNNTVHRANSTTGAITGGTYKPTANVTLNAADQVVPTGIPQDPGFSIGGGTFAPILNVTGNVYPAVGNVKTGVTYGPTGADFTGALAAGGGAGGITPVRMGF